jgi:NAD+ kinase
MIPSSPHILVTHKKSRYEQMVLDSDEDDGLEKLARQGDTSVEAMQDSHHTHRHNLERVCDELERRDLDFDLAYRGEVVETASYDLIVPVGGDGTVLDISHRIEDVPVLAINSHPESSVGYFCAGVAPDFPELLERTLDGDWQPLRLQRFHVCLDDGECSPPILNDVLISHANPAAVSRYLLRIGEGPLEEQRSSGIWVSTPAGSTAAIRSAGGFVLPIESNCMEYLVREPYPMPGERYRFGRGVLQADDRFEVVSKMKEGHIYMDGPHISRSFSIGDVARIEADAPSLIIYGLEEHRGTA